MLHNIFIIGSFDFLGLKYNMFNKLELMLQVFSKCQNFSCLSEKGKIKMIESCS